MIMLAILLLAADTTASDAGQYAVIGVMAAVVSTFVGAIIATNKRADNANSDQLAKYKVDSEELKIAHAHEVAEMENDHREELKRVNEACRSEKAWMRDRIKDLEVTHLGKVVTFFPPETHNA